MAARSIKNKEAGLCAKGLHSWVEGQRHCKECNHGKNLARCRKFRKNNPERVRELKRNSRNKKPEKHRECWRRRHAKKLSQLGYVPENYVEVLSEFQFYQCYYCSCDLNGVYDVDHKLPLSRGGLHSIENLCLACPCCNRRKHTRTEEEFVAVLFIELGDLIYE